MPLTCSQITRSQVKETVDGVSITDLLFILNILVKQNTSTCCADSKGSGGGGWYGPHPLN